MIQHVRARRVPVPSAFLGRLFQRPQIQGTSYLEAPQAEDSLDVLLKHAFKVSPSEQDTEHVWLKLARKMRGPLGVPALEGPTQSSLEIELTQSGGWSIPIPFALSSNISREHSPELQGRASMWSFLRFDGPGLPQLGLGALSA